MKQFFNLMTVVVIFTIFTSQVLAHSDTKMTIPENEAILDEAPETISIHMYKKVRLTKVEIQHEDYTALELDSSQYKEFENKFILPIETMGTGIYTISWRALGQDGHLIQGKFTFTVME